MRHAVGIIVGAGDYALVVDGRGIGSLELACPGARRVESIEDCARATEIELTASDVAAIEDAF